MGISEDAINNNLPTKQHILKIFQTIDSSVKSIYNRDFVTRNLKKILLTEKFGYYITIEILFQLLRTTEEERYFSTTNESDKHNFDILLLAITHSNYPGNTHTSIFPTLPINDTSNSTDISLFELKLLILKDSNFVQKFNTYFKTFKQQIITPTDKHSSTVNELEINKKLLYIFYSLYINLEIFSFVPLEETLLLLQNIILILLSDIYNLKDNNINNATKRNCIIVGSIYSNILMNIKDVDDIGGINKVPNLRAILIILFYSLDHSHHEVLEYRILMVLTNISSFGEGGENNRIQKYFFEENDFVYLMENRLCSDNSKIVCATLQCINNSIICLDLLGYLNERRKKVNSVVSIITKYMKIEDKRIVTEAVKFFYIVLYTIIKNIKNSNNNINDGLYNEVLDTMLKEGIVVTMHVLHQCYTEESQDDGLKNMIEDCLGLLSELGYNMNNMNHINSL